jgi:hypothetical protein
MIGFDNEVQKILAIMTILSGTIYAQKTRVSGNIVYEKDGNITLL